jgi:hypothetical protein
MNILTESAFHVLKWVYGIVVVVLIKIKFWLKSETVRIDSGAHRSILLNTTMKIVLLFSLLLFVSSCGKKLPTTLNFEDVFLFQDSIKLQSNDSMLIGSISWKSEEVTQDIFGNFYLCDRVGRQILIFDSTGCAIKKCDLKVGEGPGEIYIRPICIDYNQKTNRFCIADMNKINFYDEKFNFLYSVHAKGTVLNINPVSFGIVSIKLRPFYDKAEIWGSSNHEFKVIGNLTLSKPNLSTFLESFSRKLNGDTLIVLISGEPCLVKILTFENEVKVLKYLRSFPSKFKIQNRDAKSRVNIEKETDEVGRVFNLLVCEDYIFLCWFNPNEKLFIDVYNSDFDHILTTIEAKASFSFDSKNYLYEIIPVRNERKIENPTLKRYKVNKKLLIELERKQ